MRIYGQRLKWIFCWATVVATLHADKPFIDFNLKPITSYIRIACTRIRHVNQQSWTANFMQLKSWNHFAPSGSQCPATRRLTSCAWPTIRGSTTVETTASLTHKPFLASTIRWFHSVLIAMPMSTYFVLIAARAPDRPPRPSSPLPVQPIRQIIGAQLDPSFLFISTYLFNHCHCFCWTPQ